MLSGSIWNGIKISLFIIGTMIGAGFASGREIVEFFTSYGNQSSRYIVLAMFLFAISCYIIMCISHQIKATHYLHVLEVLIGKRLSKIYDLLIVLYLFSTTVVMFAGSGATLAYWSIPYWLGVGMMGLLVFLVFIWGVGGIITLNSMLTPFLIATLLIICFLFLWDMNGQSELVLSEQPVLPSAIAFTGLNIMPLIAILSVFGSQMNKIEIKIASIGSALGLCIITIFYNEALLVLGELGNSYEIPLFALLHNFSAKMTVVVAFILWLAIYTTAVSGTLGLVFRFQKNIPIKQWGLAGLIILCLMPLTRFGFANLIAILYPLYGILNIFILATILLYPLMRLSWGTER